MSNSNANTKSEVYYAAHSIVNKIEDIQNEARDLLTIIGDLPTNGEPSSGEANLPSQWGMAAAFNLLSIEFPEGSIATTGSGPWKEDQLDSLIRGLDIEISEIVESVYIVVVGYDTDKVDEIRDQMESSENIVQIYPQELFLSYLFTGVDPLPLLTKEQALEWIKFHPVLNALFGSDYGVFPWPLNDSITGGDEPGKTEVVISLGLDQSPLKIMGYKAGISGLNATQRRSILKKAFQGVIPNVEPVDDVDTDAYMKQWGKPNTARRLWRIAKHLAALCYVARRNSMYEVAKSDWKSDLKWLHDNFFNGSGFGFDWPE
jgi:hypothetical protein